MTEIADATGDPTITDAETEVADYPKLMVTDDWSAHPDTTLQNLSDVANRARTGLPVVLFLSGTIISGVVAAAEEFYEWANDMEHRAAANSTDPIDKEATEKYSDHFFGVPAAEHKERRQSGTETHFEIARHIHLKDAKVATPGIEPMPVGFVRVLLAHVSAWTLGGFGNN
ncbi:MAG: hypothetical protein WAW17_30295 [Rhodococcus sp. (in: high G+C Gram-positive bacteria)]|uniref:hypothetical protein n=1 Tax=Rhodococcus sp. TaxID=1831 RepID=UPI003BAEDE81